jgi:hypothetical protein
MKKTFLTSTSEAIAPYPKNLLLWNYWDHEHVVGTHFEHYKKVKIIRENEKECLSERTAKLPLVPFYITEQTLATLENPNKMVVYHSTLFNLVKVKQVFDFEEIDESNCKVIRSDFLEIPYFLKFLQKFFDIIMKKWFVAVWEEDMPMRERRYKVWKLGFRDFKGIDYINDERLDSKTNQKYSEREYKLELPVPKITNISNKGSFRLFKKSQHIGYSK